MPDTDLTDCLLDYFGDPERYDLTFPGYLSFVLEKAWLIFKSPEAQLYYHDCEYPRFVLICWQKEQTEPRKWSLRTLEDVRCVAEQHLPIEVFCTISLLLWGLEQGSFPMEDTVLIAEAVT